MIHENLGVPIHPQLCLVNTAVVDYPLSLLSQLISRFHNIHSDDQFVYANVSLISLGAPSDSHCPPAL